MKPLVPASYAQFGVGAGGRCGLVRTCGCRALSNGMENPTLPSWRPALVDGRTPLAVTDPPTKQIANLQCGATRSWNRERCVQSSLPCVDMADRRALGTQSPARDDRAISLKPCLQKRLREGLTAVEIT